jgi:subfamily B ATP-binding cassette protein MsbA
VIFRDDIAIIRWFERQYVRPHRLALLMASACMFVSNAAISAQVMLIKPALDQGLMQQNHVLIWLIPMAVLLMATINGLVSYWQGISTERTNQRIITALQGDLFDRYLYADTAAINNTHTGDVLSVCMHHTAVAVSTIAGLAVMLMRDAGLCLCMLAIMLWHDWQLTVVAMAVTPLAGIGVRKLGKRIKSGTRAMMDMVQQVNRMLSETFSAIRVVKLQGTERAEVARFRAAAQERRRLSMRLSRIGSAGTPVNEIVGGAAIAGVLLYASLRAQTGGATLGSLASFLTALLMAHQPLKRLARTLTTVQSGVVAARALKAVLDQHPTIVDAPDAVPLAVSEGRVRFADVTFAYRADAPPALRGVSFEAPPGRVLALVGPSGGGKSTIISLIPRLYDVGAGRITIDGMDIRRVTLASLRGAIAAVAQETFLFDTSVRANIAYGKPGASEDEIIAAARAAEIDEYIASLPEGYDTRVGEGGVRLSGGQRQRIAIARAVLKNAPILLLDEATSALDYETEKAVKTTLKRVMERRTTIVVAHRLATIVGADLICVVVDGRIIESGTHAELVARDGLYAGLYAMQAVESEPAAAAQPVAAAAG